MPAQNTSGDTRVEQRAVPRLRDALSPYNMYFLTDRSPGGARSRIRLELRGSN